MLENSQRTLFSLSSSDPSLQPPIGIVLRNGPDNVLPEHVSAVLGITKAKQPVAVKQAVLRAGTVVRTCNISAANHEDVVLITYDEQSHSMKAYLTSPSGVLRKALAYQAGAPPEVRSKAEAGPAFRQEIKVWTHFANQPAHR